MNRSTNPRPEPTARVLDGALTRAEVGAGARATRAGMTGETLAELALEDAFDRGRCLGRDGALDGLARGSPSSASWRALSPDVVALLEDWGRDARRARAGEYGRRAATYAASLRDRVASQAEEIAALRAELRAAREERDVWEEQARAYERQVNELWQRSELAERERAAARRDEAVASARLEGSRARAGGLEGGQREALRGALRGGPRTLAQGLRVLEALFGDRVVILPTAWSSAEASSTFQRPERAFELMLTLVQGYWSAVQAGGDAAARKCFSEASFAPRESASIEERRGARERRTFVYEGAPVVMWKHLKLGRKDSVAETWRLHFEFDAATKRIVIGHCGRHLDVA